MNGWKSLLRADPTEWLLEEENPSVRYFALTDILDKPEDAPEVQLAKQNIMRHGLVPELLEKMAEPSYVESYPRFYTAKYKGLVWSLIVLAELGASATPQIMEQCEYLLTHSQEKDDGGFSQSAASKLGGGRKLEVIPCLTGNMVWALIHFGYGDDPRLEKGVSWLTRFMRFNDGAEDEPQEEPYNRYESCWGRHTCHMVVVKALKGLSATPAEKRTPQVNATLQNAAEFMLKHHIYKRSHDLNRVSKPGWKKFGFPLMYQTDVLEILDILSALKIRDSRMDEAIELMLSKQDKNGIWHMENTYAGDRLLIPMEKAGEPSKWLTLRAMRVVKRQAELQ